MKKIPYAFVALIMLTLLNSCGFSNSMIVNHNMAATQVQLSTNNYKTVAKVSGTSKAVYVFMLGGLKKKQLFENAYSDMMSKADMTIGSRAIVNVVTEEHIGGVPPFYLKRTVTVSAQVIEFTR